MKIWECEGQISDLSSKCLRLVKNYVIQTVTSHLGADGAPFIAPQRKSNYIARRLESGKGH